jgi:hypothetical protein
MSECLLLKGLKDCHMHCFQIEQSQLIYARNSDKIFL